MTDAAAPRFTVGFINGNVGVLDFENPQKFNRTGRADTPRHVNYAHSDAQLMNKSHYEAKYFSWIDIDDA